MLIDIIAGARPNFMKVAPIIEALNASINNGSQLSYRLVHTGQHSDKRMSASFFEQLGIPEPHIKLEVNSGSQAEMTAEIMLRYEKVLEETRPSLVLVVGDVTSTLACAVAAKKMKNIPVAHVEAGIRSGDRSMPEEINRIITDSVADYFFTTSRTANQNLLKAGYGKSQIFFVGNTMIDTLLHHKKRFKAPEFWEQRGLSAQQYIVMTLHRAATVDDGPKLLSLVEAVADASHGIQIIFPVHPRTARVLRKMGFQAPDHVLLTDPLPYLEFNYLVENALAVVTDSGGISEEATVLNVPCLTLRNSTERPETCTIGTNELVGNLPEGIYPAFEKLFNGDWKKGEIPELWDGCTSTRIVNILESLSTKGSEVLSITINTKEIISPYLL